MMEHTDFRHCRRASLIKQLAAMVYDSLLIFSILFVVSAIAVIFNRGKAIEHSLFFDFYLIVAIYVFYAWFWSKSGQTLGMRVWKIKIITETGENPGWTTSCLRLCFAILSIAFFGLGYLWRLFKPYTWHDRLSQTSIIDVSSLDK